MNAIRDRVREALCIKDNIYAPFRGSERQGIPGHAP